MRAILTAAILCIALSATAQEPSSIEQESDPVVKQAMNNWHDEIVRCAAYYAIALEGIREDGSADTVSRLENVIVRLLDKAYNLHREDTTDARLRLSTEALLDEMHKDFSNFSILMDKYSSLCKEAVENSGHRLAYWYTKEAAKE